MCTRVRALRSANTPVGRRTRAGIRAIVDPTGEREIRVYIYLFFFIYSSVRETLRFLNVQRSGQRAPLRCFENGRPASGSSAGEFSFPSLLEPAGSGSGSSLRSALVRRGQQGRDSVVVSHHARRVKTARTSLPEDRHRRSPPKDPSLLSSPFFSLLPTVLIYLPFAVNILPLFSEHTRAIKTRPEARKSLFPFLPLALVIGPHARTQYASRAFTEYTGERRTRRARSTAVT